MKEQMRIGVVGNPGAWSTERLCQAVEELGARAQLIDASKLCLRVDLNTVLSQGVDLKTMDAILIKKIGSGYRSHYLDRLEMLRLVSEAGVPILSSPLAILRMLDRLACTTTLVAHGIPVPPTVVTESLEEAAEAVHTFGEAILKPLYTSKARGMQVLCPGAELTARLQEFRDQDNEFFYIQQRIHGPGHDLGVVFLGGEYLATYARVGKQGEWNTTTRCGGRYAKAEPGAEVIELARRAQAPFGLDLTCVDVVEAEEGTFVFEVSAFGGFRGVMETHDLDVAKRYAELALERTGHACARR